jgi:UPF0755 protein
MSDGGWYGYPPQEPDPYSQPQDYGDAPQTPGYDQYGRPTQPNPQHQQYYQQQQPQAQQQPYSQYQQPQQGQAPGDGQPQYRQQQRPPQRPRPQQPQQQPRPQAQNPYFQQQQQQQPQDYQRSGYDPNAGSAGYGGYEGYQQQQHQQGYDTGGYPQQQDYQRSGYDTSTGSASSPGYGSAASYEAASYGSGSYDTGSTRGGYGSGGYGAQSQPTQSQPSYSAASAARDPYADLSELSEEPDEYEYPGRGGRRRAAGTGEQSQVSEDGRLGLLSEGTTKESPSSAGVDEDDEEDGGRRRGGRSGGKQQGKDKKARRSCMVIFLFFALIAGGLGYGGYQGYNWYEAHYGPPADYSSTSGVAATAIVTVPSSASGTQIAQILYSQGVIKSERAFIEACNNNAKCPDIQADTYQLHKQMSAAAAVTALLNTSNVYNKSQLLVRPGERAADVFADLEQKTGWTQDQIIAAVNSGQIDLPSYATAKAGTKYPFAKIEGLLFTGTYQLPTYKTPTALLKAMVDQQVAMFNAVGLTQKASAVNMTPYQVLIVASMARAEAGSDASDLAKISGVIYTRLKNPNFSKLGFDTATLYGLGRTEPQPTAAELADTTNPYNLRVVRGLPPGPIDSVDQTALMGALAPTDSTDVYFCAVNGTVHYASSDTAWAQLGKEFPGYCG